MLTALFGLSSTANNTLVLLRRFFFFWCIYAVQLQKLRFFSEQTNMQGKTENIYLEGWMSNHGHIITWLNSGYKSSNALTLTKWVTPEN